MLLMEPREPGRGTGAAISARGARKESGGGLLRPTLFEPSFEGAALEGRSLGAVLGLSTLSSRNRGSLGVASGCSSSESVSRVSTDWLKVERPREREGGSA